MTGGIDMGWIYKITNQINGKIYIGKTEETDPYERWRQHIKNTQKKECKNRYLYNSMNKYGVDNFTFEPIEELEDGDALCDAEIRYIEKYRTYVGFPDCNGYNMTLGGEGRSSVEAKDSEIIEYYMKTMSARETGDYFSICCDTVLKILCRNGITPVSRHNSSVYKYKNKYGGVVMIDHVANKIVDIGYSPKQIADKYGLDNRMINKALLGYEKYLNGRSQGYTWYRLNELPRKYKPLLKEYYKTHTNEN